MPAAVAPLREGRTGSIIEIQALRALALALALALAARGDHGDALGGDPGGRAEHRGPVGPGRAGPAAQPEGRGQRGEHDAGRDQAGQQPGGAGRVQPPA
jgi:hypothetical protein